MTAPPPAPTCAAPDCGSVLNPKAPQYFDQNGQAICPACWHKADSA